MGKPHTEFRTLDMESGWVSPEGYPTAIQQMILASDLDEDGCTGSRTRLLRFAPGAFTTEPFTHAYWEEVYLLSGDLVVGALEAEIFTGPTYACRPPGTAHGPFRSETGCLLLEFHYFNADTKPPLP